MVVCRRNASNYVIHYLTKVSAGKLTGSFYKGLHCHSLVYLYKRRIGVNNFANVTKDIIY